MEIHINAGNGLENKQTLEQWADSEVRRNLERFSADVRRIEVHLSDNSAGSANAHGKRCTIEAHVIHAAAAAVTHDAPELDEAFRGAVSKMVRLLDSQVGKRRAVRDHTSIRKDADVLADASEPSASPGA